MVAGFHEQTDTPTYRTRNWPAYNEALKRQGSLTIWFDPEMSWDAVPTGRRGRQQTYSDTAIQTCLTMKVLFGMALRQTTGFVESLLRLVGLDWTVPDFSTLSRRDPPQVKWSSAMFRKTEETHGQQATEARGDCHEVTAG